MKNTNQTIWRQNQSMILKRFRTTRRSGWILASHRLRRIAAAALLLGAGLCLLTGSQAMAAAPGCPDCRYRRAITISSENLGDCDADLTDFPLLVDIRNENFLKSPANDGHVAHPLGYDIAFTDANGTPLYHDLELYSKGNGSLWAWVRVPSLSASGETKIYMVYGDANVTNPTARPSDVWDANYQGVWHLGQEPNGAVDGILDSTANANHGQSVNMWAGDRTGGRIAKALQFDGVKDYIRVGGGDLEITGNITVEFWIRPDNISGDWDFYIGKTDSVNWDDGWGFYSNNDNRMHFYVKNYHNNDITASLITGRFQHFVGVYDGSKILLYRNGVSTSSNYSQGIPDSGTPLTIGGSGSNWYNLVGKMDEVRISDTARDACWIETEYNNQSNPAAFLVIGNEEDSGAAVITYPIMALVAPPGKGIIAADAQGINDLTGKTITVDKGDTPIFYLIPDEGYEVDWVDINHVLLEDYSDDRYQFDPVIEPSAITVRFKKAEDETPVEDDTTPEGCSPNIVHEYNGAFAPEDLDILNLEVSPPEYHIRLNTGNQAIDPDNIVIPFRQKVSVCFLYEGAGDRTCDFGYTLASEGPYGTKHEIYYDINDANDGEMSGNGVLDMAKNDTTDRFGDRNKDGVVNALDNCEVLGTFDAGTELVFWLKSDIKVYRDFDYAEVDDPVYFYTKTAWNQDKYTSYNVDLDMDNYVNNVWYCLLEWGDPFEKNFYLGRPRENEGKCSQSDGWMDQQAIDRASSLFGLNFGWDDVSSLTIDWHERYPAVMVGAPADNLNAWILGFENYVGGGDTDHNDIVFVIERETGGTVGLRPEKAIGSETTDSNITGVTIGVWDQMPGGACAGQTEITYWLSIDKGKNWVELRPVDVDWDEKYKFKLQDGQKILLNQVKNWSPGAPGLTYRTRRVDFTELGWMGHELLWRADLKSRKEGCEPKILDMSLNLTVDDHGYIARATPTVLGNVLFSGSMETPAWDWTSAELRGHLKNTLIYHPQDPHHTFNHPDYPDKRDCQDDPEWTNCPVIWDAGDVLKNQMDPDGRKIYIPNVTVQAIDSGSAEQLVNDDGELVFGDGVKTTFSGRLAHYPVLATTVRISDTRETFADKHTVELDGDRGGSGEINRFTGQYELTFDKAPNAGQPITAVYSYFTYTTNGNGNLRELKEGEVAAAELGLDESAAIPSGYLYDFDNDGNFETNDDANWLINWTRGYADGNGDSSGNKQEKDWILGAIDHSVPAVVTPPASSPWFYGTAFPEDKQDSDQDRAGYRAFTADHKNRRTVVYVGARDGMLHAFDAGAFRWGDNPCTVKDDDGDPLVENRGYFQWTDETGTSDCSQIDDPSDPNTYCTADCQPHYDSIYGSGEELWAFIPANLLPRLKNNYLQEPDQAYVDASPALADVYTDGAWRTVLLSAEGNGGDTIFCLDVTDPTDPKFMWEFADPDLFRSRSSPAVAQIGRILYKKTTKWVAFFVSGKTAKSYLYPSIFVIDIADGSLVEKIELDAEPAGEGGILSGQPTIVDSDANGYVDRLYIGSDKGRLYKINIPDDPDSTKYGIGHCVVNKDFTTPAPDNASPPHAKQYEPIYGSPTVVSSTGVDSTGQMTYDIRIFFGTGDSPYYDEDINFADTRYAFFAYRDTDTKGSCDSSQVELDWFVELEKGHRIYASAFAAADTIYFGTSTGDIQDPCDIFANSDDGFDANAGRLYAFDLDGTKKFETQVGNVLAAPVVEDQHVYVQTLNGEVASFGSGKYNNRIRQSGIPEIDIHWWREVF